MLLLGDLDEGNELDIDMMFLWDDKHPSVDFGVSYGREYDMQLEAVEASNGILVEV